MKLFENDNDCVLHGVTMLIYSICRFEATRFEDKKSMFYFSGWKKKRKVLVARQMEYIIILDGAKRAIRKLNLLRNTNGIRFIYNLLEYIECLMLYGSRHVQGNALFMDYSISRR